MRKNITKMHTLRRTSPKGQEFHGICIQCGREMSMKESMNSWCENIVGFTKDEALETIVKNRSQ